MRLDFKATNRRLARTGGTPGGPLRCAFDLDPEWDGMKVAARFFDAHGTEHAALLEDGACPVPKEATGGRYFQVALMGAREGETLSTNKVTVFQEAM